MTAFSKRALLIVSRIPPGRVATYGDVARIAGKPRASRAVGNLMRAAEMPGLPYHRVIAANGRLGGYGANPQLKAALLGAEGIVVRRENRIGIPAGEVDGEKAANVGRGPRAESEVGGEKGPKGSEGKRPKAKGRRGPRRKAGPSEFSKLASGTLQDAATFSIRSERDELSDPEYLRLLHRFPALSLLRSFGEPWALGLSPWAFGLWPIRPPATLAAHHAV